MQVTLFGSAVTLTLSCVDSNSSIGSHFHRNFTNDLDCDHRQERMSSSEQERSSVVQHSPCVVRNFELYASDIRHHRFWRLIQM